MLNPQSPLPLYHQLSDIFTEEIRSGTYKTGEVIPSETLIAKQYGVGRPTVRQAMDLLVRKGLVERKRGSGTFVKEQVAQVDLFSLAGTSQAFLTKGIETASKLIHPISIKKVTDDKTNPFKDKNAFFLSRLTLVGADSEKAAVSKPVLIEDIYLHCELFLGLDKIDLENRSLSQVISDQYYLKPESGRQSFRISFLSEKMAELLEVRESDPILEVERILDFPGAEGAIFSRLYCRTDRFAFSQSIRLK